MTIGNWQFGELEFWSNEIRGGMGMILWKGVRTGSLAGEIDVIEDWIGLRKFVGGWEGGVFFGSSRTEN